MEYTIYWIMFGVGTAYAVISGIFAGIGHMGVEGLDGGHDLDAGHDFDLGHDLDLGGDLDVGHVDPDIGSGALGEMHLPAVSPITIGTFLCISGGTGIILKLVMNAHPAVTAALSALAGLLGAAAVFLIIQKMVLTFQGSSESHIRELLGVEAEVTTPIQAGGMGEIAYVSKGSRYSAPARSGQEGGEIAKGTAVVVKRIVGSTFYVTPVKYKES